jgi:hypothetical protein
LKVDARVYGYVAYPIAENESFVTVRLAYNLKARVKLSELDDAKITVAEAARLYPAGKLVRGRVTAITGTKVSLTLKQTQVLEKALTIEDFKPSTVVHGVVTAIIDTGLLILLSGIFLLLDF